MSKVITRKEYERLPKPLEGMWLTDMQDMADELKERCVGEIPEVDELMAGLISKAAKCLEEVEQRSDLNFLSYTYWACMEEAEKWDGIVHAEDEEELKTEAMLRTLVMTAWLWAIKNRIEELGGKIEG